MNLINGGPFISRFEFSYAAKGPGTFMKVMLETQKELIEHYVCEFRESTQRSASS